MFFILHFAIVLGVLAIINIVSDLTYDYYFKGLFIAVIKWNWHLYFNIVDFSE